jgi:hypothetical protein
MASVVGEDLDRHLHWLDARYFHQPSPYLGRPCTRPYAAIIFENRVARPHRTLQIPEASFLARASPPAGKDRYVAWALAPN